MATKIVTKNSSTAGSAPSASDLVQGELAVNVVDKRLYTEDNAGNIVELGTNPSTIDINGGTIDGTVIGGTTIAAISGTTGQFGTSLNVDGTATVDGLTVQTGNGLNALLESATAYQYLQFKNTGETNNFLGFVNDDFSVTAANKKYLQVENGGDISFYEDTGTTAKLFWDASAESLGIGATPNQILTLDKASGDVFTRFDKSGAIKGLIGVADSTGSGSSASVQGDMIVRGQTNVLLDTAGTTRVKIDASGNVGIGTSSPSSSGGKLAVKTANAGYVVIEPTSNVTNQIATGIRLHGNANETDRYVGIFCHNGAANNVNSMTFWTSSSGSSAERMRIDSEGVISIKGDGSSTTEIDSNTVSSVVYQDLGGFTGTPSVARGIRFFGNNASNAKTERMRIDSLGNVGIGTSPEVNLDVVGISGTQQFRIGNTTGGTDFGITVTENSNVKLNAAEGATARSMQFATGGNTKIEISATGSLYLYGQATGAGNADLRYATGSGRVTYDTSSRLVKDEIEDIPYGLNTVMALSPKRYIRTDSDNKLEVGFIADEVVEVVPELVGMMEKRFLTMNQEDTEVIAGSVEYNKITAVLVKAIQEQQTLIESLTHRIAALEE